MLAAMNVLANMAAAGVQPGFSFLFKEAGFDVSESLIPCGPDDSYVRVILTGLINTIFLAVVCLILSTVIGVLFGLISVGPSPIGRGLAQAYVELFRNLPKILILLVLFVVAVNGLPHVRDALALGPFRLSNRSINFPTVAWNARLWILLVAIFIGAGIALYWRYLAVRYRQKTGRSIPCYPLAALLAVLVLFVFLFDVPIVLSVPELNGFDFTGGGRLSIQFVVIAVTLSIYHGAQIAEVVRGGLQAIPAGQTEAARALGLKSRQIIRLIVLPQVVRIIIPPMNNQYVNLIKNTSIAIAVGYSDLMSVSGTIINQTFKPLEMMLITMGIYLGLCVSLTTVINRFHQHLTARETR